MKRETNEENDEAGKRIPMEKGNFTFHSSFLK